MAVRDELSGLTSTARAALKAQRIADHIGQLGTGQRTYLRDGVQWRIHDFGIEDWGGSKALRIVASARQGGKVLLAQDSPRNPFYFVNPPIMVPDGEEPNPDYNAADPQSRPTRTHYREDLLEAVKVMLAGVL